MEILEQIDRQLFSIDLAVFSINKKGYYCRQLKEMGVNVIEILKPNTARSHKREWAKFFEVNGPYDVIHIHSLQSVTMILICAIQAGVKTRIVHRRAYYWGRTLLTHKPTLPKDYFEIKITKKLVTHTLAVSKEAGEGMYGSSWSCSDNCSVLPSGINFKKYYDIPFDNNLKESLGIKETDFVLGHVGRIHPVKNHEFLLKVFKSLKKKDKRFKLIVVGEGVDRGRMEKKARELNINNDIYFLGNRDDVPFLFTHMIDLLVFPSKHEGLGRAIIEAQAGGTPSVISAHLPKSLDIIPGAVVRVNLEENVDDWVKKVIEISTRQNKWKAKRFEYLEKSSFSIQNNVNRLSELYRKGC